MFKHIADLYVLYQVVQRIARPWKDWEAYKAGVIDDKGNIIVDKNERTTEQKGVFTLFDVFVMNLKKIIQKVPYANSKIATYTAALFLLKEGDTLESEEHVEQLTEQFMTEATFLTEEGGAMPTNTMGGGKVAGNPENLNGKGAMLTRVKNIKKKKLAS